MAVKVQTQEFSAEARKAMDLAYAEACNVLRLKGPATYRFRLGLAKHIVAGVRHGEIDARRLCCSAILGIIGSQPNKPAVRRGSSKN